MKSFSGEIRSGTRPVLLEMCCWLFYPNFAMMKHVGYVMKRILSYLNRPFCGSWKQKLSASQREKKINRVYTKAPKRFEKRTKQQPNNRFWFSLSCGLAHLDTKASSQCLVCVLTPVTLQADGRKLETVTAQTGWHTRFPRPPSSRDVDAAQMQWWTFPHKRGFLPKLRSRVPLWMAAHPPSCLYQNTSLESRLEYWMQGKQRCF